MEVIDPSTDYAWYPVDTHPPVVVEEKVWETSVLKPDGTYFELRENFQVGFDLRKVE